MMSKEMKRVLIELCVPRELRAEEILEIAWQQISVPTFEVDQAYPVPPPVECALTLSRTNQKRVVVRSHISADQLIALNSHPYVTATWSDAPISPFEQDEEWAGAAFAYLRAKRT